VLFCYEAVDEYVMNNVREFDGKKLTPPTRRREAGGCAEARGSLVRGGRQELATWLKETLGDASPR
jgi:TNF receptor-associated protein 1